MVDMLKKKSELIKNFFPKPSSIIVEGFCVLGRSKSFIQFNRCTLQM